MKAYLYLVLILGLLVTGCNPFATEDDKNDRNKELNYEDFTFR
jgi:hypothetical protein